MPASLTTTLQTANGSVEVKGVVADVRAETTNGGVRLTLAKNAHSKHISMETTNGGIAIRLAGQHLAHLTASVTNGSIENDLGLTRSKDIDRTWPISGLDLRMETTNGSIDIHKS